MLYSLYRRPDRGMRSNSTKGAGIAASGGRERADYCLIMVSPMGLVMSPTNPKAIDGNCSKSETLLATRVDLTVRRQPAPAFDLSGRGRNPVSGDRTQLALQMIPCRVLPHRRPDWRDLCRLFSPATMSTLLILLLMLLSPTTSRPQALTEYQIKAGFFFNFTRFVEWPENAFATPTSPIVACVVGDTSMTDLLADVVVGKIVNGRAVSINRLRPTDDLHRCHLVFISAAAERHTTEILASVRKTNTLTVGESAGFPKAGGMINFSLENNNVKLEMNLDAATHAGLKVNSKLIAVSRLFSSESVAKAN